MKRTSTAHRRGPSLSIVILILAVVSVGIGFLFDHVYSLVEKRLYPLEYTEYVETYSERYDVPENILYAVIRTESSFDSGAVSEDGAVGLMQLMPQTFRWLSDDVLHEYLADGLRYDPETNIRYGACLLSRLYYVYGDWETVFAAYNAGSGHVDEWLKDPQYSSDGIHLTTVPFEETREYIKRVNNARSMYDTLYPEGQLAPSETASCTTADSHTQTTMEGT